ncbi:hypothetical protein [Marinovum sp.]|uniref:hypothetical protein n=1 Tax=Marinovum sp. TaxID=2024839 RepID=UPI003A8E9937
MDTSSDQVFSTSPLWHIAMPFRGEVSTPSMAYVPSALTAAKGRRASPGRPPARRLVCPRRAGRNFFGFGWDKALLNLTGIAAPRPGNARLALR